LGNKKFVGQFFVVIAVILFLAEGPVFLQEPFKINFASSAAYNFYGIAAPSTTIVGNPTQRHAFQPVHNDSIIEVDKVVDGNTWKFLAYDCDPVGTIIRLYYSNNTGGTWTPYSGNPILGPKSQDYRWPSTTYVNGVFYMFVEDYTGGTLERWNSTDGIHFTFLENVKSGGNQWKNPFIWYNTNDRRWYLYSHDSVGTITENLKVRSSTTLDGLKTAGDITLVSRNMPFGSPTMMYFNGVYWLLGEIQVASHWQVVAYYSTSSPSGSFTEAANSPVITSDESCPMLFLMPSKTKAYLYTVAITDTWVTCTHEVLLSSPPPTPSPTPMPTPSPTPTSTPIPTPTPSPTPAPTPTAQPTPTPTATPTPQPTPIPTSTPTPISTPEPTPTATPNPPINQAPAQTANTPQRTPLSPTPSPKPTQTNPSSTLSPQTPSPTPKQTSISNPITPSPELPVELVIGFMVIMSIVLSASIFLKNSQQIKNIRKLAKN
jgi:hypothetical protein